MKNHLTSDDQDSSQSGLTRRRFLETTVGTALVSSLTSPTHASIGNVADVRNGVPYHTLGDTGEKVSCIGLGGYHIGMQSDEQESIRIIRTALDQGINFLDNCWDYNDGNSEIRMGKALQGGYRQKAFLMTKIDSHTKQGAAKQIDESLKRLQTDHLDLLQFHEIIRPSDPERIFAATGGSEPALAAQKWGKPRFLGFPGHKSPEIPLAMLAACEAHGFVPDTVQMPLN